jgi:hypothetical protein
VTTVQEYPREIQAEPLGNRRITAGSSPNERRRRRYTGSAWLHQHSKLRRVRECGNLVQAVCEVKLAGDTAHYAGLRSCGSPWACTYCAPKIAAGRVEEIAAAVQAAIDDGHGVAFLTATFSHHAGQPLRQLQTLQQEAWRHFTRSPGWRRLRARFGLHVAPRIREVTYGQANGWHPHIHACLVSDRWLTGDELGELQGRLGREWRRALEKVGLSGTVEHALRVQGWSNKQAGQGLAAYLAKQLALEVAGGAFKEGHDGRYAPAGVLAAAMDGETWAIRRWGEYEVATAGKRTIFWPPKWPYRPKVERTDEELAAAEVGGGMVVAFDAATKQAIFEASPRGVELLELAERSPELAVAYVRQHAPPGAYVVVAEVPGAP